MRKADEQNEQNEQNEEDEAEVEGEVDGKGVNDECDESECEKDKQGDEGSEKHE
jgi:hypothetical protein